MNRLRLSKSITSLIVCAALVINTGKAASLAGVSSVVRLSSHAATAACQGLERSKVAIASVDAIIGLYRQSVDGLPAHAWDSPETLSGNNYLAITRAGPGELRVRVSTKEVNGHDCGFDSRAILCGSEIWIVPNQEEEKALAASRQTAPKLAITHREIKFLRNPDGTAVSGAPYCGNRGALDEAFKRRKRNAKIDDSLFTQ
jgi:hypothetical protein